MKRRVFLVVAVLLVNNFVGTAQEMLSLEQAIALALEKNYDIKLAKRNADATQTDNSYALGAFLPQVNGTAAATWNDTDQEFNFADETRNTSGNAESNNVSAAVQLVWTLFDGTRMFATRERIQQLAIQGNLLVKDQMANTIASVVTNYFDIVRQKQQLRAIQEQMSVNEERVKLAERKLQVGTGAKPELLQARVDLNAQRTSMYQQQALIVQLKEQLNVLVGLQLQQPYEVADSIAIDSNISREEIVGTVTRANFSILAAERSVAISTLSLRERQAERFPIVNFNAAYNFNHNNNTKLINPFSSVESEIKGFNYGLTLSLPILNGFNTARFIKQASISLDRQQILLDQQKATTTTAANNAYVTYENGIQILKIEEENILLAKENVVIALESFKRGVSTFIELRTAQQSLETAYNRLITARFNAKVAETELLRLSGALVK